MHRLFTIHRDGDLLVEDLDESRQPVHPEPVSVDDRLPVELILKAPNTPEARAQMMDLLELAFGIVESEGTETST